MKNQVQRVRKGNPNKRKPHVVPSTAVQTSRVLSELVDDLLHLVGRGESLDELQRRRKVVQVVSAATSDERKSKRQRTTVARMVPGAILM